MGMSLSLGLDIGSPLVGKWGRTGPAYDPDATAYFAVMSVQPTDALKALVNSLILGLKTGPVHGGNIWAKTGGLHFLNMHDAQAARINARQPGTFDLTAVNSPTFTAKVGYTGNGSSAWLDPNFTPSINGGGIWTLNSASMFGWALEAGLDAGALLGDVAGSSNYLWSRFTDGKAQGALNGTAVPAVTVASGIGFYCASITASATLSLYKNGASISSAVGGSPAVPSTKLGYMRWGASNYYAGGMAIGGWASGLTANDNADLYAALNTFKTGVDALP